MFVLNIFQDIPADKSSGMLTVVQLLCYSCCRNAVNGEASIDQSSARDADMRRMRTADPLRSESQISSPPADGFCRIALEM